MADLHGGLAHQLLAVPVYGTHQQGELLDLGRQGVEGLVDQEVPLLQAKAHQLHPAAAEGLNVGRRGEAQQAGDFPRRGVFRVDDHIDAHVLFQFVQAQVILRVADAGDGVLGSQVLGGETADHVHLVGVGGSHQQIGVLCSRFPQGVGGYAVALDAHNVQRVGGAVQGAVLGVHDSNVMLFVQKLLRQRKTDFSGAYNDDFHSIGKPLFLI